MSDAPCKPGDTICLTKMGDDPAPLPAGATGTVRGTTRLFPGWQISVDWDHPHETRTLCLITPEDTFSITRSIE